MAVRDGCMLVLASATLIAGGGGGFSRTGIRGGGSEGSASRLANLNNLVRSFELYIYDSFCIYLPYQEKKLFSNSAIHQPTREQEIHNCQQSLLLLWMTFNGHLCIR